MARYGFTATELERQKLSSTRYLEQALIEKDKSPSAPLADEFIRNFMNDEPIPGIVYEQGLSRRFLPQITLAEVNSLARTWVADGSRVVVVSAPERARREDADRGDTCRRDRRGRRRRADRVRRYREHAPAARSASLSRHDCQDVGERSTRHHGMAVVQWRAGRAQADDVQGR